MKRYQPWRHNGKILPWWIGFTMTWGNGSKGRFWKRRLAKARRRAWKDAHERGLAGTESRVNWKDW